MKSFKIVLVLFITSLGIASCFPEEDLFIPKQWEYDEADIQTTDSGLMYVIHEEGEGAKPNPGDIVILHYSGFFEDGEYFDSSRPLDQPLELNVGRGQVIEGFDEGILDMPRGEKRTLIIPAHLAYGDEGNPPAVPPGATLIFDIEILRIIRF